MATTLSFSGWLGSVAEDLRFGWRQLRRSPVTSGAAILSLALAIGACVTAFRLTDALLFRPLPIAGADRLYGVSHPSLDADGQARWITSYEYPLFERLRAAVAGQAELIAVSPAEMTDVTYATDVELEKASLQYVSGWLFTRFGIRPAVGRLLTASDDATPGAHPVAVISDDYWARRFARDPAVVGKALRLGAATLTIVGVAERRFTGTDAGTVTDVFVPAMMNPSVGESGDSWIRILVHLAPGVAPAPVLARMRPVFHVFREERTRTFQGVTPQQTAKFLAEEIQIDPAPAGVSRLQLEYARPLAVLGLLVALVLLIACANVANLLAARTASRARELALRVAIGAARRRVLQLVLIESALLTALASVAGALLAWWAAPVIASTLGPSELPVRLDLSADARVLGFGAILAFGVTLVFGLLPALRAASVHPTSVVRGGDDAARRRRLMPALIAGQTAFCVVAVLIAGLFVATSERLSRKPTGFSAERVLLVDVSAREGQPQAYWDDTVRGLEAVPGVERAALAAFPLLARRASTGFISLDGKAPDSTVTYFLNVSPGWLAAMRLPLVAGRDFRPEDVRPGAAIVNQAFVRRFFPGVNPIGRTVARSNGPGRLTIVGVAGDAAYRDLRGAIMPTAYLPFRSLDASGAPSRPRVGTLVVRTTVADPAAITASIRREIVRHHPALLVTTVRTHASLVDGLVLRERLLARLGLFFAGVALLLAGVGLYGVLDHTVVERRREVGIRLALGARALDILRAVAARTLLMGLAGAVAGLAGGLLAARFVAALFYDVTPSDPAMLALPLASLAAVASTALLVPAVRALRVDPVRTLRQ